MKRRIDCLNYPSNLFTITGFLLLFSLQVVASAPQGSPTGEESLRINLYLLNENNKTILADGVLSEYNRSYHDSVTIEDAYKMTNIRENLGLNRYGTMLAIERRPDITGPDTLFMKLWKTSQRNYQLEFVGINLDQPGVTAFLQDAYLGTSLSIGLNTATKVNFSVNADSASSNINRFRIIYQTNSNNSPLPVTFTSFKGSEVSTGVALEWNVEHELNLERYEVERSANGLDFSRLKTMAVNKLEKAGYSWKDSDPLTGNNFYRIRSVDKDGSNKFSTIIKISISRAETAGIIIYPNPVRGNTVNLRFINQPGGNYQLRMINNAGQVVYSGKLPVNSANLSQSIVTSKKLAGGIYQLEIRTPGNRINVQQVVVQE
jgi:hypothetical protein